MFYEEILPILLLNILKLSFLWNKELTTTATVNFFFWFSLRTSSLREIDGINLNILVK